jgi:hypothetical protein
MKKLEKYKNKLIVARDDIKKDSAKVGQAAYDLMTKSMPVQTVEETYTEMTPIYFEKLQDAAEKGCKEPNYPDIFWVFIERRKNTLMGNVQNVLQHRYFTSAKKPKASLLQEECPNSDFDVYEINKKTSEITLLYTLVCYQDARTILKNPHLYDPALVRWTKECAQGLYG